MNKNVNLAPIAFFAYNRAEHTRRTLEALKSNDLAAESTIHIFVDGPKVNATAALIEQIEQVKQVVQSEKWCREVHYHFSEENKGCRDSIVQGIDYVMNLSGKAIIVEDDILTSRYFLTYMNLSLNYYERCPSVFSIAGHAPSARNFHKPNDYTYDVFAYPRVFIWGWATWKDRWKRIDWEMKKAPEIFRDSNKLDAFTRGGDDLVRLLSEQYFSGVDNWDIQVNLQSYVDHSLSIVPCTSYVMNIGLDGTGAHCVDGNTIEHDLTLASASPKLLDIIYEDKRIVNQIASSYANRRRPVWKKAVNRLSRILGFKNVFTVKKKVFA